MKRTKELVVLVAALLVFGFVALDTGYQARLTQARIAAEGTYQTARAFTLAERVSCRKGLADRRDNADAWYAAYIARHDAAQIERLQHRYRQAAVDHQAALLFLRSARDLNSRTYGRYTVRFDVGHKVRYPLGKGELNCVKAFPWPKRPKAPRTSFIELGF